MLNFAHVPGQADVSPHSTEHKSGFSRVMLAAAIANVGDPLLGGRTATAKTEGGNRAVGSSLGYRPSASQPISPQRRAIGDRTAHGHLP